MAEFKVMNVNFRLNGQHNSALYVSFAQEILETKPDVIFVQGNKSQKHLNDIDVFLQDNDLHYSYYCRLTKQGLSSVMIKPSTFNFELVKRDRFNIGTPENRRCLFNGLTCVKLTHIETKIPIFVGSWHSDNTNMTSPGNDALILTKSMTIVSQNGLWMVGGSFSDQNGNEENKFLIGISRHRDHKLCIKNIDVSPSQSLGMNNFPVTASIYITKQNENAMFY